MFQQDFKLGIKFGHPFSLCHSANYHPEVFRFDTLQQLLEAGAFFARFNFLRNRNLVIERDKHEVASGK